MGVREIDRFLEQWQIDARDLHRRMILAPTPRERERWHAVWLLAQGWTASVWTTMALSTGTAIPSRSTADRRTSCWKWRP